IRSWIPCTHSIRVLESIARAVAVENKSPPYHSGKSTSLHRRSWRPAGSPARRRGGSGNSESPGSHVLSLTSHSEELANERAADHPGCHLPEFSMVGGRVDQSNGHVSLDPGLRYLDPARAEVVDAEDDAHPIRDFGKLLAQDGRRQGRVQDD